MFRAELKRQYLRISATALVVGLAATQLLGWWTAPLVGQFDRAVYDGRMQLTMPNTRDERVVIVDIDEASLAQIDNLEDHLEEIERKLIMQALEETRWNRTAAAQRLGLTFRSMRYRLKKLGRD